MCADFCVSEHALFCVRLLVKESEYELGFLKDCVGVYV